MPKSITWDETNAQSKLTVAAATRFQNNKATAADIQLLAEWAGNTLGGPKAPPLPDDGRRHNFSMGDWQG